MRDPNYKLRTVLTKISRLNKPYGPNMRFEGDQPDTEANASSSPPQSPSDPSAVLWLHRPERAVSAESEIDAKDFHGAPMESKSRRQAGR